MTDTLRKVGSSLLKVGSALNIWDGTGDPCCCGEVCSLCDGSTPQQMQVVFNGILDLGGTGCSDCVTINGTWVLDIVTTGTECIWETAPFDACSFSVKIRLQIIAGYTLKVQIIKVAGGLFSEWRATSTPKFDCDSFSSFDVPPFNETVNCDLFTTPSTCLVTAL